jgi:hypothetical protein
LLIDGGYADSVLTDWLVHHRPHGLVWPPKRVFETCQFLWGLLWLADCASRPRRGTIVAAIGYLCMVLLFFPTGGIGYVE